jgi:hypothetical protein
MKMQARKASERRRGKTRVALAAMSARRSKHSISTLKLIKLARNYQSRLFLQDSFKRVDGALSLNTTMTRRARLTPSPAARAPSLPGHRCPRLLRAQYKEEKLGLPLSRMQQSPCRSIKRARLQNHSNLIAVEADLSHSHEGKVWVGWWRRTSLRMTLSMR